MKAAIKIVSILIACLASPLKVSITCPNSKGGASAMIFITMIVVIVEIINVGCFWQASLMKVCIGRVPLFEGGHFLRD